MQRVSWGGGNLWFPPVPPSVGCSAQQSGISPSVSCAASSLIRWSQWIGGAIDMRFAGMRRRPPHPTRCAIHLPLGKKQKASLLLCRLPHALLSASWLRPALSVELLGPVWHRSPPSKRRKPRSFLSEVFVFIMKLFALCKILMPLPASKSEFQLRNAHATPALPAEFQLRNARAAAALRLRH